MPTAVQEVKALESKARWCRARELAVWTSEVWEEQNLALNQHLQAAAVSCVFTLQKNKGGRKRKKLALVASSSQTQAGCFGFSQNSSRMGLLPSTRRVRFISIFFLSLDIYWFIYLNNCTWFTVTGEGSVQSISALCHSMHLDTCKSYSPPPPTFWFVKHETSVSFLGNEQEHPCICVI